MERNKGKCRVEEVGHEVGRLVDGFWSAGTGNLGSYHFSFYFIKALGAVHKGGGGGGKGPCGSPQTGTFLIISACIADNPFG